MERNTKRKCFVGKQMKMVFETLQKIQTELKAPKDKDNDFGKYKYRSCESILESVKPILSKYNASIILTDNIELIGDRFYVKATAFLFVDGESISTTAWAREPLTKKGMDEPQVTGTASSYARKYALNGLLAIDDTKDADTNEYHNETNVAEPPKKLPFREWIKNDEMYAEAISTNIVFDGVTISIGTLLKDHKDAVEEYKKQVPEAEPKITYCLNKKTQYLKYKEEN